jgi:hypothetical protein
LQSNEGAEQYAGADQLSADLYKDAHGLEKLGLSNARSFLGEKTS